MSIPVDIASPCIEVCALDRTGRVCTGCFRSLDEIAGWASLTDAERAGVIAALPERRRRFSAPT